MTCSSLKPAALCKSCLERLLHMQAGTACGQQVVGCGRRHHTDCYCWPADMSCTQACKRQASGGCAAAPLQVHAWQALQRVSELSSAMNHPPLVSQMSYWLSTLQLPPPPQQYEAGWSVIAPGTAKFAKRLPALRRADDTVTHSQVQPAHFPTATGHPAGAAHCSGQQI